jgi:chromosome segregation ATPase
MQSVNQRNMELTLEDIRAETVAATADLTAVNAQKARAKEDLADIRKLHQVELAEMEEHRAELEVCNKEIIEKTKVFEADKELRLHELSTISDKIRDAMKELRRINGLITAASDEKERKDQEIRQLNRTIAESQKIVDGIIALQNEYAEAERRRDDIRRENTLAIENAQARTAQLKAEADQAEARSTFAKAETAYVLNQRDHMIKEKNRISADLEIYIRRIEAKYQEAFPDLRMTL